MLWTLGLTAIATVIGMAVGVGCAWARTSGPTWLRWVIGGYVELMRNTPFIVQLFFIFFGLPAAGIEATPRGQSEAAVSLALDSCRCSCAWCCHRR